jgi:hypothetical protein
MTNTAENSAERDGSLGGGGNVVDLRPATGDDGAPQAAVNLASAFDAEAEPAQRPRPRLAVIEPGAENAHLIGTHLRSLRTQAGLSADDVAKRLFIKPAALLALEDMRPEEFFQKAQVRYTVRKVAELLNAQQPQAVADQYFDQINTRIADSVPSVTPTVRSSSGGGARVWAVAAMGTVAVAVVATMAVTLFGRPSPTAQRDETPTMSRMEALALEAARRAAAEGRVRVVIKASRPAMLDVRGADGTIFIQRDLRAGETYMPRYGANWVVSVRDAGAFRVVVNDVDTGPLGGDGVAEFGWRVDTAATRLPAEPTEAAQRPTQSTAPSQAATQTAPIARAPRVERVAPPPPIAAEPLPPGITADAPPEVREAAEEDFAREVLDFN